MQLNKRVCFWFFELMKTARTKNKNSKKQKKSKSKVTKTSEELGDTRGEKTRKLKCEQSALTKTRGTTAL